MPRYPEDIMKILRQAVDDRDENDTSSDSHIESLTRKEAFAHYMDWEYGARNAEWVDRALDRFGLEICEKKVPLKREFVAWNTITRLYWDGVGFKVAGGAAKRIQAGELAVLRETFANVCSTVMPKKREE